MEKIIHSFTVVCCTVLTCHGFSDRFWEGLGIYINELVIQEKSLKTCPKICTLSLSNRLGPCLPFRKLNISITVIFHGNLVDFSTENDYEFINKQAESATLGFNSCYAPVLI